VARPELGKQRSIYPRVRVMRLMRLGGRRVCASNPPVHPYECQTSLLRIVLQASNLKTRQHIGRGGGKGASWARCAKKRLVQRAEVSEEMRWDLCVNVEKRSGEWKCVRVEETLRLGASARLLCPEGLRAP
jgi:hypothetical protein